MAHGFLPRGDAANGTENNSLTYIAEQCITSGMKLGKDLVAATSVPLVLSILCESENYGYAILQRVKELSGGRIQWTDGMLYPVLHWLEDRGYVSAEWRQSDTGRKRKYYRIEEAGQAALQDQRKQWDVIQSTFQQLWGIRYA